MSSTPYQPPTGGYDTTPPPNLPPTPPPGTGSAFFDSLRRSGLIRSDDRWIGGVAAGIAHRFGIDPLVVRGVLVVLSLFGGIVLVAYGVAWALLPEASDGRIHLQEALRGRFDGALAGAVAFVLLGLARPVSWLDPDRWVPGWLLGLAWVGLLVTVIVLGLTAAGRSARGAAAAPDLPLSPPRPNGAAMSSTPTTDAPAPYPADAGHAATPDAGRAPSYPAYASPTAAGSGAPPGAGQAPPAWQPPPQRPRPPGPGSATVAVVLALTLFAGAGVLLAHRAGVMTGSAMLAFAGLTLVVLGVGVLLSGARGRRAGALAGIGVVVAVLAVPAAVASTVLPRWGSTFSGGPAVIGDVTWAPATVEDAEGGFSYAVGEGRVDLTGPDWVAEGGELPAQVRVESGAGSTTVVLPSDVPLEVRAHIGAGEVRSVLSPGWGRSATWATPDLRRDDTPSTVDGRDARTEAQGTDVRVVLRSPAAEGVPDGALALVVTLESGFGDITIQEEEA